MSEETNWFFEKQQQVDVTRVDAFGIELTSRYGRAREMIEMLQFAERAAKASLNDVVISLFYDSQACICNIRMAEGIEYGDSAATAARSVAEVTIGQFELFDVVGHGPSNHPIDELIDGLVGEEDDEHDEHESAIEYFVNLGGEAMTQAIHRTEGIAQLFLRNATLTFEQVICPHGVEVFAYVLRLHHRFARALTDRTKQSMGRAFTDALREAVGDMAIDENILLLDMGETLECITPEQSRNVRVH